MISYRSCSKYFASVILLGTAWKDSHTDQQRMNDSKPTSTLATASAQWKSQICAEIFSRFRWFIRLYYMIYIIIPIHSNVNGLEKKRPNLDYINRISWTQWKWPIFTICAINVILVKIYRSMSTSTMLECPMRNHYFKLKFSSWIQSKVKSNEQSQVMSSSN